VSDEPDVVDTHILINVNEYQDARHKEAEQNITPLRNSVRRIKGREKEQVNEQTIRGKNREKIRK